MEKIWFRYFRFVAYAAVGLFLTFSAGLFAQDNIKTTYVDVEVTVSGGDLAAAKQAAQKAAFEKAVEQILPINLDAAVKAEKLKRAAQSIKSFQVVDERIEGESLKQRYKCDVILPEEVPTPQPSVSSSAPVSDGMTATFEIAWLPEQTQFNAVELRNFASDVLGTPPTSVRIQRGNIVLTVPLKKSLEEIQNQLAAFVGKRGLVKLIHQDANRPPDLLPAPVPVPPSQPIPQIPGMLPNPMGDRLPPPAATISPMSTPLPGTPMPQQMMPAPVMPSSTPLPQWIPAQPSAPQAQPAPQPVMPQQPAPMAPAPAQPTGPTPLPPPTF